MPLCSSNVFIANDRFKQVRTFDHNTNFVLPMHSKRQDPRFVTEELQRRAEMYLLPFINEKDPKNLFPACDYNPSTLLAEAFPLCFSALYCHSLRGIGCSRFVLVVNQPRKRPLPTAACDSC